MKPPFSEEILARRRRVSLSIEEIALIEQTMRVALGKFVPAQEIANKLAAILEEELRPEHRAIVDAYRAAVEVRDGEFEMDDDAEVSLGDDPGAYVMVWKWVPALHTGICEKCGSPGADDGDGWDGLCGDCADAEEGGDA